MSEKQDFLVEIGTEELPPTALRTLSEVFGQGVEDGLWLELPSFIRQCVFMKTEAILHKANRKKREKREKEKVGKVIS